MDHKNSVLTLYRTLLREVVRLPYNIKEDAYSIVRKEFRSSRKASEKRLQNVLLEAYRWEKQLFLYYKGELEIKPIENKIEEFRTIYHKRSHVIKIKNKPTIIESYPPIDPLRLTLQQNEQRLTRHIKNMIKADQGKSLIPHKSKLDETYLRHIYGTRAIYRKAKYQLDKMDKLYGEESKPPELKYSYNFSDKLTLISLMLPTGKFKELDREVSKQVSNHLDYLNSKTLFENYEAEFGKWIDLETEWEAKLGEKDAGGYRQTVKEAMDFLRLENTSRLNNEVKPHNRKVMFLKSKLKPLMTQYHTQKKENFNRMVQIMESNEFDEFNDYSTSLSKLLQNFKFDDKKFVVNWHDLDTKLDPKEFDWTVDDVEQKLDKKDV